MPSARPPERVLLVRLSHLGDIAQALPLLHALRARWPAATFGWAVQPEFAPLVEPLAEVIPFDRRGGLAAWRAFRRAAGRFAPDLVVDAQGNWKSAVAARVAARSGGARRVAFAAEHWQEPLAARILRPELAPAAGAPHLVARCLALAHHLTGSEPATRLDPELSDAERVEGRALLGPAAGGPPVVLHPGVPGDPRSWPTSSFGALGERLLERRARVVVVTGPGDGERSAGEALRPRLPEAHHVVGQRGIRALAAALEVAAASGGCIVTGDSGPAHVAASVGLPVALLAGPEDPARTGPWPAQPERPHVVVGPPWARRRIDSVTVDDAVRAVEQLVTLPRSR